MTVTGTAAYQLDNSRYSLDSLAGINSAVKGRAGGETDFFRFLKPEAGLESESSGQTPPRSKIVIDKKDKLYEQCEALETFLLKTLINGMRKTIDKSEFSDGGFAGQMYEDMLYDEYAKDFTRGAKFGLAEMAYLELSGQRGRLMTGRN
jgi:flagellar protein FlgJ